MIKDTLALEDEEAIEEYAALPTDELMATLAKCSYIKKKLNNPDLIEKIDNTVLYIREILVERYAIQ